MYQFNMATVVWYNFLFLSIEKDNIIKSAKRLLKHWSTSLVTCYSILPFWVKPKTKTSTLDKKKVKLDKKPITGLISEQ